jgi:ketosteroid isomerase-like protein
MHPNEETINKFYSAFQRRDHAGMAACYHPDVEFSDMVFLNLKGTRACAMWQMLCERGKDLAITFSDVRADDRSGQAHWEADYTFSVTGRKVHNVIDARFQFQDGKIIKHQDSFDLWKWASMALGAKGLVLGWLPPVQNSIRKQASDNLEKFLQKRS